MKQRSVYRIMAVLLVIFTLFSAAVTVSAESSQAIPYESYTYWENGSSERKAVYSRAMYEIERTVSNIDLKIDNFGELADVYVDDEGKIYLLDSSAGIIILDENYNYIKKIECIVKADGEICNFSRPQAMAVCNKKIYICDTDNARVLVCDENANYIDEFTVPNSPLIPENFDFKPIRVAITTDGYTYVLSDGSYYGALLYAPNKDFICFYGANTVTNGIFGALQSLFKRVFPSNKKSSNSERMLPFTFTDLVVDEKGFVYTATDSGDEGQIKKLNPGLGENILGSDDINFIDEEVNREETTGKILYQRITGIDVDDNGNIFALDSTYGRIFVYDSQCRMINAFGGGIGEGTQKGMFMNASAIAVTAKNDVLVTDKVNNTLTVFKCNEYGQKVFELLNKTNAGNYDGTKEGWNEVLKADKNLQVAYSGLARAYLAEDEYVDALKMAKKGYDRETYATAFEYYRNEKLSDNFTLIFVVCIALIAVSVALFLLLRKKKIIKNQKLKVMLSVITSPSNSFEAIKEKGLGSVWLGIGLVALFYLASILNEMFSGFLFSTYDVSSFNSIMFLVRTVGLVVLWSLANWLISSLSNGKGRLKEIFIVTCYSLIPLIIGNIAHLILSRFLLPDESVILSIISGIAILWFLLLMVIGLLRIHEYSMMRLMGTSILTVLGMAAIIFLCVLIMILMQQLIGFVATVFAEMFM